MRPGRARNDEWAIPRPSEITVAEHRFRLLTVARDPREGRRAERETLQAYLAEGGRVFYTVKSPDDVLSERKRRPVPLAADTTRPGMWELLANYTRKILGRVPVLGWFLDPDSPPVDFKADEIVPNRRMAAVRAFAWHPTRAKFAICVPYVPEPKEEKKRRAAGRKDKQRWILAQAPRDRIYFRDLAKARWDKLILAHQFQINSNCMAWSKIGTKLAVGCDHGICLWTFLPEFTSARMQFLPWPGKRIASVEWSPCGTFIATSAVGSPTFIIWDVAKGSEGKTPFTGSSEVTELQWSPDGRSVFVGTRRGKVLIFQTSDWSWRSLSWRNAKYTRACWNRAGNVLLLANAFRPSIRVVNFSKEARNLETDNNLEVPGGIVHNMVWSPTSERLAISIRRRDRTQKLPANYDESLIAVYGTRWKVLPEFIPLGFIRGPPSKHDRNLNMPTHMSFRPECEGGALLAVVWAEGQISLYPLVF